MIPRKLVVLLTLIPITAPVVEGLSPDRNIPANKNINAVKLMNLFIFIL
ncbi:MAG: hypothetical protein KKB65_00715 [Nanoarchaeota archaeon]|nr:hypothetical protein [Nanoarchaeota archaeon]MBU1029732.1 hypothetical protein [Nanoarchaeota archaeon]MBU1849169.1 hypothetical protein [Nanoarchaeota archaeon]